MLFAAGVGVGLFFYGVAEPLLHYTSLNRYTADSYTPDNELAQQAINLTLYHWGNVFTLIPKTESVKYTWQNMSEFGRVKSLIDLLKM